MKVLRNATLIPMTGPGPDAAMRADIVIDGDRIARVGPDLPADPGAEVHDFSGKFIMPGLIDAHCHLTYSGGLIEEELRLTPAQRMVQTVRNAYDTLLAGITTVRDTGGIGHMDIVIRDAVRRGVVHGPDVVACGQMIAMTGGHGWFYGIEADGPAAVRRAVRAQVKAKSDWVKFMASGGFAEEGEKPDAAQLDLDELTAGVREAHRAGRRTSAHAHSATSIKNAVRAGIDTVEHASFMDDEALEMILARDIHVVPTLSIYHKMMKDGPRQGLAPFIVELVKRYWDRKMERFSVARAAGARIAAGTDNGSPIARHGDLTTELELFVEGGMTPYEALSAATVEAARLLGRESLIGTIEAGRRADLAVLERNPLENVAATRSVCAVFKGGALYVRDGRRGRVTTPDLVPAGCAK